MKILDDPSAREHAIPMSDVLLVMHVFAQGFSTYDKNQANHPEAESNKVQVRATDGGSLSRRVWGHLASRLWLKALRGILFRDEDWDLRWVV